MTLIFLELKHTPSIFSHYLLAPYGWEMFYVYFVMYCNFEICMDMNDADPFICCYDISGVAKHAALPNIFSGILGNTLDAMIFTFLHTKFAKDLPWCFF